MALHVLLIWLVPSAKGGRGGIVACTVIGVVSLEVIPDLKILHYGISDFMDMILIYCLAFHREYYTLKVRVCNLHSSSPLAFLYNNIIIITNC